MRGKGKFFLQRYRQLKEWASEEEHSDEHKSLSCGSSQDVLQQLSNNLWSMQTTEYYLASKE